MAATTCKKGIPGITTISELVAAYPEQTKGINFTGYSAKDVACIISKLQLYKVNNATIINDIQLFNTINNIRDECIKKYGLTTVPQISTLELCYSYITYPPLNTYGLAFVDICEIFYVKC